MHPLSKHHLRKEAMGSMAEKASGVHNVLDVRIPSVSEVPSSLYTGMCTTTGPCSSFGYFGTEAPGSYALGAGCSEIHGP